MIFEILSFRNNRYLQEIIKYHGNNYYSWCIGLTDFKNMKCFKYRNKYINSLDLEKYYFLCLLIFTQMCKADKLDILIHYTKRFQNFFSKNDFLYGIHLIDGLEIIIKEGKLSFLKYLYNNFAVERINFKEMLTEGKIKDRSIIKFLFANKLLNIQKDDPKIYDNFSFELIKYFKYQRIDNIRLYPIKYVKITKYILYFKMDYDDGNFLDLPKAKILILTNNFYKEGIVLRSSEYKNTEMYTQIVKKFIAYVC